MIYVCVCVYKRKEKIFIYEAKKLYPAHPSMIGKINKSENQKDHNYQIHDKTLSPIIST